MSQKIFVSFLGTTAYDPVSYKSWKNDGHDVSTSYVQRAILELYPHSDIDVIVLFVTKESLKNYEEKLKGELNILGVDQNKIETEIIPTDFSDLSMSWKWFESLQSKFKNGDSLILDVTNGPRMVPIIFSAAVAYLKRVKNVHLDAVLYAWKSSEEKSHKAEYLIVNLKDFYTISDWTEGVGRLVDTADPSFLRKTAENEANGSFAWLNNQELLDSIDELTNAFRNVELQNLESKARRSLDLICKFKEQSRGDLEEQVLKKIIEKFQPLISEPPLDGTYSLDYLKLQLRLIKMLAEYKLYMQAFTAMNEWLGSLGVYLMKRGADFEFNDDDKEESARWHADVFLTMLEHYDHYSAKNPKVLRTKESMDGAYRLLIEKYSSRDEIKNLIDQSKKIRNGFDHGWTGKNRKGAPQNLEEQFNNAMATLEEIVSKIEKDA